MFLLFPVPPDTIVNQQVHGMLDYTVKQLKVKLLNETVICVSLQARLQKSCKRRLIIVIQGLLFQSMDCYRRSLWYMVSNGNDSYSFTVYCHVIVCMQPYSNDLINNNTKSRCIEAKLKGKLLNSIGNIILH